VSRNESFYNKTRQDSAKPALYQQRKTCKCDAEFQNIEPEQMEPIPIKKLGAKEIGKSKPDRVVTNGFHAYEDAFKKEFSLLRTRELGMFVYQDS
jgi:hypothetical protein